MAVSAAKSRTPRDRGGSLRRQASRDVDVLVDVDADVDVDVDEM